MEPAEELALKGLLPDVDRKLTAALLLCGVLAELKPGERRSAKALAKSLRRASATQVIRILQPLVAHGLVDATAGHLGGYRLARPGAEVTLADVVLALSGEPVARILCPLGFMPCERAQPCPIHARWIENVEPFAAMLRTTTIAETRGSAPR